jgi:signal recognition particle receptor subunit beta
LKNGYKIKYLLYASPGKEALRLARELVISGTDGIVFVVDSDKTRLEDNIESLLELRKLLENHGIVFGDIPIVFQYNKRDLPAVLPVEELRKKLNIDNFPGIEAEAISGKGVFETFKEIAKLSLKNFIIKCNLSELECF